MKRHAPSKIGRKHPPAAKRKRAANKHKPMVFQERGKVWIWIGVFASVLVLAGVGYFLLRKQGPQLSPAGSAAANVYPQFPRSLIFENSIVTSGNYIVTHNTDNSYIASWKSTEDSKSLDAQYKSYLASMGWQAAEIPLRNPSVHQISANTGTSTAIIAINGGWSGSTVTITYVTTQ